MNTRTLLYDSAGKPTVTAVLDDRRVVVLPTDFARERTAWEASGYRVEVDGNASYRMVYDPKAWRL